MLIIKLDTTAAFFLLCFLNIYLNIYFISTQSIYLSQYLLLYSHKQADSKLLSLLSVLKEEEVTDIVVRAVPNPGYHTRIHNKTVLRLKDK